MAPSPQDNVGGAPPRQAAFRQVSFAKIAAIFLIIGPLIFGLLFWLVVSIANPVDDPLHTKIKLAFAIAFFGIPVSYAAGLIPSLVVGFVYSKSRRHISGFGYRLVVAALIGAAVYCLLFAVFLPGLGDGRLAHDWRLFTAYAAGAGAVSMFVCALIVENWT